MAYPESYWLNRGYSERQASNRVIGKADCIICKTVFYIKDSFSKGSYICSELCLEKNKEVRIEKYKDAVKHRMKCYICGSGMLKKNSIIQHKKVCSEKCLEIHKTTYRKKAGSNTIEYWLQKGLSLEEANTKISAIQKERSPRCVEYWIKKGFTKEESINKITEQQSNTSKLNTQTHEERQLTNPKCKEYWIEKGNTEEEALKIISKKQRTVSLAHRIEKYGVEEGTRIYDEWRKTHKHTISLEGHIERHGEEKGREIWLKKYTNRSADSLISREFFLELYKKFPEIHHMNAYFKGHSAKEFGIRHQNGYYFFDFVIPKLKFCIEFNGSYFHADPRFYKEDDILNFFGKKQKAKDIWDKDKVKIETLEKLGYDVCIVWWKANKHEYFNAMKVAEDRLRKAIETSTVIKEY